MNKIEAKVSKETNYIYHMLSVAKCGYDNEYGNKYSVKHSQEDLQLLKDNESLLTVKGGEHCGDLYYYLVSVPASLDMEARLYYESLEYLFKTGNVEESMQRYESVYKLFLRTDKSDLTNLVGDLYKDYAEYNAIVPICEVMKRNYPIYSDKVWEETKKELLPYAKNMEAIFNQNGLSEKLEKITNEKLKTQFIATFCNSLDGGAEKFISHKFTIYLLKQLLMGTTAFKDLKYWRYTEWFAEFYLSLVGKGGGSKEGKDVVESYREIYQQNNTLTASELYTKAIGNL